MQVGGGRWNIELKFFSLRNVPGVLKRQKCLSFFSLLNFFFFKNVPGALKRMQTKIYFSGGGGDFGVFGAPHAPTRGSENNTLLPMAMTCDRLKFWSGPAWRSKVIIRKPWRRKKKKF